MSLPKLIHILKKKKQLIKVVNSKYFGIDNTTKYYKIKSNTND